jgi:hypothetical protein
MTNHPSPPAKPPSKPPKPRRPYVELVDYDLLCRVLENHPGLEPNEAAEAIWLSGG